MENQREAGAEENLTADENPNSNSSGSSEPEPESASEVSDPRPNPRLRTPFTSLGQVDADLALARALQEQETAYMMLRMNGGSGYGSSDSGSYVYEDELDNGHDHPEEAEGEGGEEEEEEVGSDYGEDAFDANDDDDEEEELNPADFESDEAFARALQDAEEREVAVRLMALSGLNDWGVVEPGERARPSQDAWQEVDPDELSYEELVALGEVVGTESRGLSADTIASLQSVNYKVQDGNSDQCVICRLEYEEGEPLVLLSCKHAYHSECINRWLQINKVCPICSAEVSTSTG
ncbi:E3 ubiquitin ligase BIG BROTHER-related [Iris pallida]|uniref:E3 ubiquitin ligase BIG BROTHER-related n=1 Tax=Iris pallida TaxID=29817 RepID=A0AAX6GDM2_IRIPA|nr:E3 ubiquitin ligase BIG BROTHER-related [Iris pallida]